MDFKENVEKMMLGAGPEVNRDDLLVDVFKHTIADFFIWYLENKNNGNRLPTEAVIQTKSKLINEFRGMKLDNQKSVEWYEDLFESTIKEIFNDAALAHRGEDRFEYAHQNLQINKDLYQQTASGIYLPK